MAKKKSLNQYAGNNMRKVHRVYSSPGSLWLIPPQAMLKEAKIEENDYVEFKQRSDGTITFCKIKVDKRRKTT